jgi:hypothetical protein
MHSAYFCVVWYSRNFQTWILEVLRSNIGRDDYPEWDFRGFPQPLQINSKVVPQLGHYWFLPKPLHFIDYPTILHYIV